MIEDLASLGWELFFETINKGVGPGPLWRLMTSCSMWSEEDADEFRVRIETL